MTSKQRNKWKDARRILLILALLLLPVTLWAQRGRVSLNLQNEEVSLFIQQVEKQTRYTFVYRNNVLQPQTKVTLVCKDLPLEKALSQVFAPLGIQYSFNNSTIVLIKEKADKNERKTTKPSSERTQMAAGTSKLSGVVRDANGDPIIGASVLLKGTKVGTITNADGEFALDVPADGILLISYIGFATREVAIKKHAKLKITLDEDEAHNLNEVVVVGYGTQKKASVTGAIASVTTKDLVQTPQANISNMLVGKMPGLIAMQRSGAPGEDQSTLLIRGVSTFGDD